MSSSLRIVSAAARTSLLRRPTAAPSFSPRLISAHQLPRPRFATYIYDPNPNSKPKRSILRRFGTVVGAFFVTTAAFFAYEMVQTMTYIQKSDEDTIKEYKPLGAEEKEHDDYLNANPFVIAMRTNPDLSESRPSLKIPPAFALSNLTAGTLMGPKRVPFPPLAWQTKDPESKDHTYAQISYVGEELCGHPGIVHGGYLATVLDEGLARCGFAALPSKIGVTANLSINYRAPCKAEQYIVLTGRVTKAEGRKVWVEGRIETLPESMEEKPVVLAEATGLFIQPKQLGLLGTFYSNAQNKEGSK